MGTSAKSVESVAWRVSGVRMSLVIEAAKRWPGREGRGRDQLETKEARSSGKKKQTGVDTDANAALVCDEGDDVPKIFEARAEDVTLPRLMIGGQCMFEVRPKTRQRTMFSRTRVTFEVDACARLMASATYPMAIGRFCFMADPGLDSTSVRPKSTTRTRLTGS